jgi:hypothetical protein
MPNCSICGIAGHNKKTCGVYNNTMPKSSAFYDDYKKNVQKSYDYAKKQKEESGRSGPVFRKSKNKLK